MRNMGSGTIRLRGIPSNALVLRAFLYFGLICETGGCPATVDGDFEGRTITLSKVGTAANPCWGSGDIAAYRADVTGLMPSTSTRGSHRIANGDYQLTGFPSGERTGSTPWQGTPARPLAEGATLLVIYRHGSTPSGSRVYIHEGVESLLGANAVLTNTLALSPAGPAPVSTAILTRFGADGQTGEAPAAFPDLTGEKTYVGPSPAALTQIAGPGSTRDLDSDWNGADGGAIAQLWDTRTTDVTGLIPSGASSYAVRYTTGFDCLTTIGYVLQLEGGGD
jgi:hypothetical protein